MSGWDIAPAPAADEGFQADNRSETKRSRADTGNDGGNTFTFAEENVSRHANGNADGAPHDGGCRNCGDPAHFVRDCPTKPPMACYNCGEQDHMSAECTKERVERECYGCHKTGHLRSECPDQPAKTCNICKGDHIAAECTVSRMTAYIDGLGIPDMPADDAWKMLEAADADKDVDDIRTAMLAYAKAHPAVTFEELESVFRGSEFNTHLIAKQQEVADTHTIVNVQGQIDQEFVVSIQFSAEPRRKAFAEGWPETPEINMERLTKAGITMDRMSSGTQAATARRRSASVRRGSLPARIVRARAITPETAQTLASSPGSRWSARIAVSTAHATLNDDLRHLLTAPHIDSGETGHKAADCPNERVLLCYNCDARGHSKMDCPEPRRKVDWSTVQCGTCKEMGHSYKRCPQAPKEDEEGGDAGFGDAAGDAGGASNGGW
ncbi:hypothetical protein LTR91_003704 [Friedmanniomyces endolithicus]|uniref:CCHC-type domain-containing protein n=2 Tax=Dothideomycetidae TaxID=451867 RepID=A0AAN6KYW4_9PEZI|nr:hypothetical protein LTR38_016267 [Friedmanniomyces endolithicus]KAK5145821.1 hypothetical protein LTR32_002482 [Rachicladosporium monterosium]KAK0779693.1 hypothetical protein LTR59_013069 [Friedmanniomyces endolithicus]KAK0844322.1 hypothetical protein LTS02_015761 [Friedmanniomyces endolithicus]KAK0875101.1 hypothetical protein LTR87_011103 [Friedmanniomyces endolithicus]